MLSPPAIATASFPILQAELCLHSSDDTCRNSRFNRENK